MKLLICTFLLVWAGNGSYAQSRYLFTLAELKQLANCPDKTCFQKAVLAKGYEFNKAEESTAAGNPITIYLYRVLSTGQQPYYAEHLIAYSDKGAFGRSVSFFTKSQAYPALLDADIAQEGYVLEGAANPDQNRNYSQEEGELIWMLSRNKPGFSPSRGTATYMVSLASLRKPAAQRDQPVAIQPTSSEPAHLGGDWDAKYPPQNAADLFRAERRYAADYDRQHGKQGHTFSRAEKCRIQAKFMNQFRPLTEDRWSRSFDSALRYAGFDAFANEHARLYKQEALLEIGSERVWMPVQEIWVDNLRKEATVGQPITLYAVLTSYHDFGGTLHLSFLANEFAASKKPDVAEATTTPAEPAKTLPDPAAANKPTVFLAKPAAKASGPEDFKTFIQRFSTDKAFQLERVKFPLIWDEYSNNGTIPHRDTKTGWKHINVLKESAVDFKVFIQYPTSKKPTEASVSETCRAGDCGYGAGFNFKQIDGVWYCVSRYLGSD